jgi:hypothetical protein
MKEIKPKLVEAVKQEFLCLVQGLRHQVFQACRSFRPCTRAWALADIAYVLRQYRASCRAATEAVQPKPTVFSFVAVSTWEAVKMMCSLAGCDFYRLRDDLTAAALWADEHFTAEDEVECQKNLLRWYRGDKWQAYVDGNRSAIHMMCYVRFVCNQRPSTAHIESGFSHTTGRAGKSAQTLSVKRMHEMLVLKATPRWSGPIGCLHRCLLRLMVLLI